MRGRGVGGVETAGDKEEDRQEHCMGPRESGMCTPW